jgi:hypothetical protein
MGKEGIAMCPFESKAQARYMFARHPEIAKEFASHTRSIKSLPEHKKKTKAVKGRRK